MANKVIGIAGPKGSGKTTLANYIAHREHALGPVTLVAFADPLKEFLRDAFGLSAAHLWGSEEQKNELSPILWSNFPKVGPMCVPGFLGSNVNKQMTYREVMQYFGTDIMRSIDPDCWVRLWEKRIAKITGIVVAHDVRFDNEAEAIHRHNGKVIQLLRGEKRDPHCSEKGISQDNVDCVIDNRNLAPTPTVERVMGLFEQWGWV